MRPKRFDRNLRARRIVDVDFSKFDHGYMRFRRFSRGFRKSRPSLGVLDGAAWPVLGREPSHRKNQGCGRIRFRQFGTKVPASVGHLLWAQPDMGESGAVCVVRLRGILPGEARPRSASTKVDAAGQDDLGKTRLARRREPVLRNRCHFSGHQEVQFVNHIVDCSRKFAAFRPKRQRVSTKSIRVEHRCAMAERPQVPNNRLHARRRYTKRADSDRCGVLPFRSKRSGAFD